ncbi:MULTISPECIES: two-component system response regulator [unclassified Sporosarcina]|uniref:response regulator n=1 Tax=unclassified Sporosarcina TaxID=2647733 RepID=UPI0013045AE8|nr:MULTISPECIES: response regulator [unclassified Sporosarcina]
MKTQNSELNMLDASLFRQLFYWQMANTKRFRQVFTVVFVKSPESPEIKEILLEQIRNSDLLFNFPTGEPDVILMANTGEEEADVFIDRLRGTETTRSYRVGVSVIEIRNGDATLEEILQVGNDSVNRALQLPGNTPYVKDRTFRKLERQCVRVSIIDEDPIVTMVIQKLVERVYIKQLDLDIRVFHDGQYFIESDWYQSSHTHLVIVNDILPRKNGLEVLYTLRELPNAQKYHVFMMTKRKSEAEMIFAYENGVDDYITKPFNPHLFESQIKKVLNRIYYG